MSEQAPDRLWSGIQISKVIAGTLAAVAAAVLGSFLGVAGTLAGAALASVVGSVGTEIFNNSLKRGTRTLQTVAPTFIKAPAAVGTPPVAAAAEEEKPSHLVPEQPSRQIRWAHIGLATLTLFVLSMGAISVFEAFTDKPLSATVKNTSATGSTVFGSSDKSSQDEDKPATEPSESPSADESADPSTSTTESPDPDTSTTQSPEPTETTTAPVEPTTEPTDAPQQETDPAQNGEQQFNQQQQEQDPTSE
jgi:hypothetical protein